MNDVNEIHESSGGGTPVSTIQNSVAVSLRRVQNAYVLICYLSQRSTRHGSKSCSGPTSGPPGAVVGYGDRPVCKTGASARWDRNPDAPPTTRKLIWHSSGLLSRMQQVRSLLTPPVAVELLAQWPSIRLLTGPAGFDSQGAHRSRTTSPMVHLITGLRGTPSARGRPVRPRDGGASRHARRGRRPNSSTW